MAGSEARQGAWVIYTTEHCCDLLGLLQREDIDPEGVLSRLSEPRSDVLLGDGLVAGLQRDVTPPRVLITRPVGALRLSLAAAHAAPRVPPGAAMARLHAALFEQGCAPHIIYDPHGSCLAYEPGWGCIRCGHRARPDGDTPTTRRCWVCSWDGDAVDLPIDPRDPEVLAEGRRRWWRKGSRWRAEQEQALGITDAETALAIEWMLLRERPDRGLRCMLERAALHLTLEPRARVRLTVALLGRAPATSSLNSILDHLDAALPALAFAEDRGWLAALLRQAKHRRAPLAEALELRTAAQRWLLEPRGRHRHPCRPNPNRLLDPEEVVQIERLVRAGWLSALWRAARLPPLEEELATLGPEVGWDHAYAVLDGYVPDIEWWVGRGLVAEPLRQALGELLPALLELEDVPRSYQERCRVLAQALKLDGP